MKSLLKETNAAHDNKLPPSYNELSFVSSYPYPAKFAKIAEFLRNNEISKSTINPLVEMTSHLSQTQIKTPILLSPRVRSLNFSSIENTSEPNNVQNYQRMPPYSINWSEHFSVNSIISPTPSSLASDDSGRGSEPSDVNSSAEKMTSSKSKRYQCLDCNKHYSTQSGLQKHQEFHCSTQIKKTFSCKHCEKVYVSLGALKMHIRTHTLPCKCKLCGKAFSRPWLLQGKSRVRVQ